VRAAGLTAVALLMALLLQTVLSQLAPQHARVFDPFLLVLVYCGLAGGEVHGMLAGAAAGWVQDVQFGGPVAGVSALSKLLVGFGAGAAAGRFLLTGPGPRLALLLTAYLADALLHHQLAALFDLPRPPLAPGGLLVRGAANALLGTAAYELLEQRLRREARP
jgi:rod shape-determining protein MreD